MTVGKAVLNEVHGALVFRRRVRILANLLAQELPTAGHVLDVGAGDGSIAGEIVRRRPDITIEGIDVLMRPATQIPVSLFDGTHLPLDNRSVDVVTFVDVLHHMADPSVLLREAARVTRRYVLIKDHLKEGVLGYQTLKLMDWIGNYGHRVVLPYNYLTLAQWHGLFRDTRLRPDRWIGSLRLYPFPVSLIFDRRLHFISRLTVGGAVGNTEGTRSGAKG